ncbi:unnamed protein product [Linum trigynum]|uniref:Uncharacterized protein n=1 Tax=Linum trigynum TaxID=586398 RepID=A0AAV2CHA5_9ROSI
MGKTTATDPDDEHREKRRMRQNTKLSESFDDDESVSPSESSAEDTRSPPQTALAIGARNWVVILLRLAPHSDEFHPTTTPSNYLANSHLHRLCCSLPLI